VQYGGELSERIRAAAKKKKKKKKKKSTRKSCLVHKFLIRRLRTRTRKGGGRPVKREAVGRSNCIIHLVQSAASFNEDLPLNILEKTQCASKSLYCSAVSAVQNYRYCTCTH